MEPEFTYPYRPDDRKREDLNASDDMLRLVRGGSWDGFRVHARCAFRYWYPPGGRFSSIGFRVVLRSSPVS